MRELRSRLLVLIAVPGALACGGVGLPSPGAELNTGQAILDLNELIVTMREENAMMQAQIDSLREVVARQDTVMRQVALQVGVPVPPPR